MWSWFKDLKISSSGTPNIKRRYSITADILSYQQCPMQYGQYAIRKYEPSLVLQLFFGTVVHQVLDRAHKHFQGLIDPSKKGMIPTDTDITSYFEDVVKSLRARQIIAGEKVRDAALEVIKRFNRIEGPSLYPRVISTECKLQSDHGNYILHGNVDVLATAEDGDEVEIWDYKATDYPSKKNPLYDRYIYQMHVYAQLYQKNTGKLPKRAILYFVNALSGSYTPTTRPAQNVIMEITFDPTTIQKAIDNFGLTVNDIENCRRLNSWPAPNPMPEEKTCVACDRRWNCSALTQCYERSCP